MDMPQWLESEFARTGLPRSALAEYLGLDNAAITRISRGERNLSAEECEHARAFFSVVPQELARREAGAVRKLRSARIRRRITAELAQALRRGSFEPETDASLEELIDKGVRKEIILRADQIVAVCRSAGIGLDELLSGSFDPSTIQRRTIDVRTAPSEWARRAGLATPYDLSRGAVPTRPQPARGERFIVLARGDERVEMFRNCTSYVVPDNSLVPWFDRGAELYLEKSSSTPRPGDYIALLRTTNSNQSKIDALIGKLVYSTRDSIRLSLPDGREQEFTNSEPFELRRIGFCGYR